MAGYPRGAAAIALVGWMLLVVASNAQAQVAPSPDEAPRIGPGWLVRVDSPIPADLALQFGRAAVSVGLTKAEAAKMLNDQRFAMALGSSDQGYGMLEGLIESPDRIPIILEMLSRDGYTTWGPDSIQGAIVTTFPELRNAYLADVGLMAVERSEGVWVLVDLESGRRYIGQGRLGAQLRAPGGGPIPSPPIAPEEVAAQMWEDAGFDPSELESDQERAAGTLPEIGPGPGLDLEPSGPPERSLAPAVYLLGLAFLVAWGGYAVLMVARRVRA